jgi:hypothetical protein
MRLQDTFPDTVGSPSGIVRPVPLAGVEAFRRFTPTCTKRIGVRAVIGPCRERWCDPKAESLKFRDSTWMAPYRVEFHAYRIGRYRPCKRLHLRRSISKCKLLHASNYTKTDHVSQDVINLSRRNGLCGTKTGLQLGSEGIIVTNWLLLSATGARCRHGRERILRLFHFRRILPDPGELWPYRNYVPLHWRRGVHAVVNSFRYWSRYPVRRRFGHEVVHGSATGRKLCRSTYNFDTSGTKIWLNSSKIRGIIVGSYNSHMVPSEQFAE